MNGLTFIRQPHRTYWQDAEGRFHSPNEDTPAIIYLSSNPAADGSGRAAGTRVWYNHGMLHRLTGPAVEQPDGEIHYWINDRRCWSVGDFIKAGGSLPGPGKEVNLEL